MRRLRLLATAAMISFATAVVAQTNSGNVAPSSGVAADRFAKEAFRTLYTLPRSPDTMKAIPALLHDEAAWQMFLQRNFSAPNVGLATLKDLTATYTVADSKPNVKVLKSSVSVGIAAIQNVRVFGRLAGKNCVATTLYLDMPKGIDDATGATIKDVVMITTTMEDDICEPLDNK